MASAAVFHLLALSSLITSGLAAQPSAPQPIPAPLRDLQWGQLNFLHTTDTHGWLAGHLQEPFYSADWGDYVSFATRMREKAESEGRDLLLVDTGDRVEGNGLYDSSRPQGIYLSDILKQQHIDVLSSGNHELYKQNTSEAEFLTTVPNFRGNYLASNIDIIDPRTQELVPLAPRFKKFTTQKQGIRILAFGFLFDFTGNYKNTVVQPVEETIKEEWFQEAIQDRDVDLFLVVGHVPVRSKEYTVIFKEIRNVHWDTPIQFFGGHAHIRDYVKYDSKAYGLASGRFMETIGFMSIDGLGTEKAGVAVAAPTFSRTYIDNNLFSFLHHADLDESRFHTEHGQNVSRMIEDARKTLHLDVVHGCAPKDLWMTRVPYPSDNNIYSWLENEVLPDSLRDKSRHGTPALAIVNTGAIRFDIFKGPFTRDTTFIISPFTNGFRYIKDVPRETAERVLDVLNSQPRVLAVTQPGDDYRNELAPPIQRNRDHDMIAAYNFVPEDKIKFEALLHQVPLSNEPSRPNILPGYTTRDDGGDDGDDTIHSPIPTFRVPNCIQASIQPDLDSTNSDVKREVVPAEAEKVDLVYVDFIERHMIEAAKFSGLDVDFKKESAVYMPGGRLTDLILTWVKENWKCVHE
ncbi:Metallo-dependent phosphatase-like protein [Elaphomyces granulatus]